MSTQVTNPGSTVKVPDNILPEAAEYVVLRPWGWEHSNRSALIWQAEHAAELQVHSTDPHTSTVMSGYSAVCSTERAHGSHGTLTDALGCGPEL